jgi:hypothetical protein
MIKVKHFLDEHFDSTTKSTSELKKGGHYCVHGQWVFRVFYTKINEENIIYSIGKKTRFSVLYNTHLTKISKFEIRCFCNNETIQIHVLDDGKFVGRYGYLQTYQHIPRGEPDDFGYYQRSTDEEIIKYIESYMTPFIRDQKLIEILE